jgi:Zn-dependent protease with chaperone function/type II secretory pathway pseudopilin PulG
MEDLVYPRERTLGAITLVLGVVVWIALIVGTAGVALLFLLLGFVAYLFIQSTLISHIKGNGVLLTEAQFPDLHAQFVACCDQLKLTRRPEAYVLNGGGALNAFATKFLGAQYLVLLSGVVEAMRKHEDGVRFYMGHELGHLRMKHLQRHFLRWPVLWLPLLGAAYSRARETTCDRHGLLCSSSPAAAARSLSALSAGSDGWKDLNLAAYQEQLENTSGFWMSFHELTAGYPWLTKRVARVMNPNAALPRRNPFAYLIAIFTPYAGRLGGGFGLLVLVYIIAILAAIGIPAYQDYVIRAKLTLAAESTQHVRAALTKYYEEKQKVPDSLEAIGIAPQTGNDIHLSFDSQDMVVTVETAQGSLVFTPRLDANKRIIWVCSPGEKLQPSRVPPSCRH